MASTAKPIRKARKTLANKIGREPAKGIIKNSIKEHPLSGKGSPNKAQKAERKRHKKKGSLMFNPHLTSEQRAANSKKLALKQKHESKHLK
jgi:hypothetical protein